MEIFDDLLRDGEPESMTRASSTDLVCLVEAVEDMWEVALRYADTRISDLERLSVYDDFYISIWSGELLCIPDDISDRSEKELWIDREDELLLFYDFYTRVVVSEGGREEYFHILFFWIFDVIASEEEECIHDT